MCDLPYTNLPVNQSFNQKTDEAANNDRETLTEREREGGVQRGVIYQRGGGGGGGGGGSRGLMKSLRG